MRTNVVIGAAAILATVGCSGSRGSFGPTEFPPLRSEPASAVSSGHEQVVAVDPAMPAPARAELAMLPAAPWAAERLETTAVPDALIASWRDAENRAWCAPVAPSAIDGAIARAGEIYGGWSVEFDHAGSPGVRPNGSTCPRCGRAAFGIVGTAMTPEDAVDPDAVVEPAPTFNDGSRAEIAAAASRSEAASATIVVAGQGCVYQVWSFLGEEHLRGLVDSLRLVAIAPGGDQPVMASLSE
jgi:hypothetical protein